MSTSMRRSQGGMALVVALIVLVVVSILGVTSMRSALFQGRISVNQQASQLLFQGAESGVESVFDFSEEQIDSGVAVSSPTHIFYRALIDGVPQRLCYDADGAITVTEDVTRTVVDDFRLDFDYDDCDPRDENPLIVSAIVSEPPPGLATGAPPEGFSLIPTGFVFRQVYSQSFANISGLGYVKSHVQMWSILIPNGGE